MTKFMWAKQAEPWREDNGTQTSDKMVDGKNSIAVHVHKHDHQIDWDRDSIVTQEQS